jgi:hypothetical protein
MTTVQVRAFKAEAQTILNVLTTQVRVAPAFNPQTDPIPAHKQYIGIWDTGATNSVINENVVADLGLQQIGITKVYHAQGCADDAPVYLISMGLPNGVGFTGIRVTKGSVTGADLLVGMDIISRGDFSISNFQGRTLFSYRVPSIEDLDLSRQQSQPAGIDLPKAKVGRNAPCPCGSGKKYKRCCGVGQ